MTTGCGGNNVHCIARAGPTSPSTHLPRIMLCSINCPQPLSRTAPPARMTVAATGRQCSRCPSCAAARPANRPVACDGQARPPPPHAALRATSEDASRTDPARGRWFKPDRT
eukprot:gene10870-biopygen21348